MAGRISHAVRIIKERDTELQLTGPPDSKGQSVIPGLTEEPAGGAVMDPNPRAQSFR